MNSPRSLEACRLLGIDPQSLYYVKFKKFAQSTYAEYTSESKSNGMLLLKHDDTLSGNGVTVPLSVAYSERYDQLYEQFEDLYNSLTADGGLADLSNAMKQCKEDLLTQIKELSGGHIQNYELILQLMGVVPNSGNYPMIWANDQGMHSDDKSSYQGNNTLNWMYYSTYQG